MRILCYIIATNMYVLKLKKEQRSEYNFTICLGYPVLINSKIVIEREYTRIVGYIMYRKRKEKGKEKGEGGEGGRGQRGRG